MKLSQLIKDLRKQLKLGDIEPSHHAVAALMRAIEQARHLAKTAKPPE